MHDLDRPLAGVKGRWMTGLAGADAAPPAWRALIGTGPEAELRLLALTGQAMQVGFRPVPAQALTPAQPLPTLALPTMPDEARMRFRRIAREKGMVASF